MMKNSITVSEGAKDIKHDKILFSNVLITGKRNLFFDRTWRTQDIRAVILMLTIHLLALCAPFTFTWRAFFTGFFAYVLGGTFGITLSYHRNLSHRSFKLPKWLEYTFAYIGLLCMQRDPIYWVSVHRYHHQYVDSEKDIHSPIFGFWFSHIGWAFDSGYILEKYQERKNVEDLKSQVFYKFIQRTYFLHPLAFASIVYAFGGFTYLVWVLGVATTWGLHSTFLVNSACHIWGNRAWNTNDLSKNNWLVALLTFGEGWHNNHHAFEYSARHGLEWWQIDFGWYIIRFLEAVGLATNVKLPTQDQKLKKSFDYGNKFK